MRKIQKLTLSLLTVAAVSSWNTTFADTLTVSVPSGEATYDTEFTGSMKKTNPGTLLIEGVTAAAFANLEISGGTVKFNDTNSMPVGNITFDTIDGNVLEVNAAGANVPVLTMTNAGQLLCDTQVNLVGVPVGEGVLSVNGAGPATVASDLSASSTPMAVMSGATVQIGGASKLPGTSSPAFTVDGLLEITSLPAAGAIGGSTVIEAAGTLKVDDSITVPGLGGSDIFNASNLTFKDGATLELGNGVVWNRPITVGSAN